MGDQEAYERAKSRVEAKLGFFIHLAVYIVVNGLLIIINMSTSPKYLWFIWPLIGWGIGVIFHGLGVFFLTSGAGIKERLIETEMRKQTSRLEKP